MLDFVSEIYPMSRAHNTLKVYDNIASKYDDHSLKREHLFSFGRKIFTLLRGNILEVGVGTGINLPYYHPSVHITALDWSPRMVYQAREKVRKYHLYHVEKIMVGDIMRLSNYFGPESFNFVTSTCVFCSVPDPIIGLREIAKILKPSGYLIQLEHGSSNFGLLNLFMKPIDLLTVKLGGYHITRNTLKNLKRAGFKTIRYWPLNSTGTVRLIVSRLES